jgi:hypothetical protein
MAHTLVTTNRKGHIRLNAHEAAELIEQVTKEICEQHA